MSQYMQWYVLYAITGSPIGALVALLVFWWIADRFTLRVLPDPVRALARWRRREQLRRTLAVNPNDRRARFELADLLVGVRRYSAALEVLKPSIEAGDHDAATLFVFALACLGSGHPEQGEVFLEAVREADPNFRVGAVDLELGRWRLARGDAAGAKAALERFCQARTSTIEGKVLLARALQATGDAQGARRVRAQAWADHASAPAYHRRQERFWAWRARPSRPITYAAIALLCVFAFMRVGAPWLSGQAAQYQASTASGWESSGEPADE